MKINFFGLTLEGNFSATIPLMTHSTTEKGNGATILNGKLSLGQTERGNEFWKQICSVLPAWCFKAQWPVLYIKSSDNDILL